MWEILCVLQGLMLAIYDHAEIDADEAADTLRGPIAVGAGRALFLNKGVLLAVGLEDAERHRPDQIVVSPYLLIPHAMLIHNEAVLQQAEALIGADGDGATGDVRARASELLSRDLIGNVMHYGTERTLVEVGRDGRGLRAKEAELPRRLRQLDVEHTANREESDKRRDRTVGGWLGALSVITAFDALGVILAGGYAWWGWLMLIALVVGAAAVLIYGGLVPNPRERLGGQDDDP